MRTPKNFWRSTHTAGLGFIAQSPAGTMLVRFALGLAGTAAAPRHPSRAWCKTNNSTFTSPQCAPALLPSPRMHACLPEMCSALLAVCIVAKRMMVLPTAMFCTGNSSKVMYILLAGRQEEWQGRKEKSGARRKGSIQIQGEGKEEGAGGQDKPYPRRGSPNAMRCAKGLSCLDCWVVSLVVALQGGSRKWSCFTITQLAAGM